MKFHITQKTTGANFGIIITNTGFKKYYHSNSIPNGSIKILGNDYYKIRKLYGLPFRTFPPERFKKPYEPVLKYNGGNLPWKNIIPHSIYQKELLKFINELKSDFRNLDLSYYNNIFKKQNSIFNSLEDAAIDMDLYAKFIKENANKSSNAILKTFAPIKQSHGVWKAASVKYDRLSTVTGRLTGASGPQILLLKKEYRKCLSSIWGSEGGVYSLDYKSLEPRLLLTLQNPNLNIPKDPYLYAARSMGVEGKIDRSHIKTAIISMIYGAGNKELIKQLKPFVPYPKEFIASVREQFGVDKIKEKVKNDIEKTGGKILYNHFGRPIMIKDPSPYILINHFIQSTAVDVALLGFLKIINKIIETGASKFMKPLFILHDALIMDVHNSMVKILPKLSYVGSTNIPKFENTKFWIEIEKLNK